MAEGAKRRDPAAQQQLWERYFVRLTRLARGRLRGRRLPAGSEDVAQEALASFFRAAQSGRFPLLSDRNDLWRLLVVLATRKASAMIRRENRQKRGGGKVISADAQAAEDSNDDAILEWVINRKPTPDDEVQIAEEYELLLRKLDRKSLRQVAEWKTEGWTNAEIAAELGCVSRTVERKLNAIRSILEKGDRS